MPRPATGQTPGHNVRAPRPLWETVKAIAKRRGETITDVVVRGLRSYVTRYGTPEEREKAAGKD